MICAVHGSLPQAALSGIHYARPRQAGLLCVAGHMLALLKQVSTYLCSNFAD